MTKRNGVLEATQVPVIRSPDEDAERALRRQALGYERRSPREARRLTDPDNPLRMPGESAPRPEVEDLDEDED
jgi:hypothetical protein